jgi:complex iron-sulfur molybdoenzyme family reductase subunit gamma
MLAKKVALNSKTLLDPASPEWEKVPVETVNMGGTPLANQPSRYIRTVWADRPIGKVRFLNVRAAHNGKDLLFHLEWRDESRDVDYGGRGFPDGAGVLFPLNGDALLTSMGSEKAPVNGWFWRADQPEAARNVRAQGIGTVEDTEKSRIAARSQWEDGTWRLVLSRPLAVANQKGEAVQLAAGASTKVAFAVWEGGTGERAGIKAFSKQWRELTLEG